MALSAVRFCPKQGHRIVGRVVLHNDRQPQATEAKLGMVDTAQSEVFVIDRVVIISINDFKELGLSGRISNARHEF